MDTVYLETTVVGNIAGRIHPNPRIAARQNITREWWLIAASNYRLLASAMVISECSDGDASAATERLQVLNGIELLASSEDVDSLAQALIDNHAVPASESRDAFHIAIAAVNGVDYLLTWNFKHIANASLRHRIELVCRDAGFEPPIICTPDELMETDDGS